MRPGVVIFDDFNDPKTGWPNESAEQRARNADEHYGYIDGLYRLDRNVKSWRFGSGPKIAASEFTCEVVARVYGDNPTSSGSMIIAWTAKDKFRSVSTRSVDSTSSCTTRSPAGVGEPGHAHSPGDQERPT